MYTNLPAVCVYSTYVDQACALCLLSWTMSVLLVVLVVMSALFHFQTGVDQGRALETEYVDEHDICRIK